MNRFTVLVCVLVASGIVLAGDPPTESKAASAGSYAAEVTASQLHLRAGPTAQYQSVALVEQGRRLVVRRPAAGGWMVVEVPGGFGAWVSSSFIQQDKDGMGTVTANRLLVRPRPSTAYHQLSGTLQKGEQVKVLGEKSEGEIKWLRVHVPQRIPLYCMGKYLTKIGPASMALAPTAKTDAAGKAPAGAAKSDADERFIVIEKQVRVQLDSAKTPKDLTPIRRTLAGVNGDKLSIANQRRHIALERELLIKRNELVISDVELAQKGMLADLEREIAEIEANYRKRIAELEDERRAKRGEGRRFVATGVVEHKPDLLGRTPGFRITEGGKLRYFLIAPAYDLHQFRGKRVGVTGIVDRESGTGYSTVMVKRIEILSEK